MARHSTSKHVGSSETSTRSSAHRTVKRPTPKKRASSKIPPRADASPARPGTKLASLIALLSRKEGATITELMEAMKWQPHSVRGAISGTLKKKLGLDVTSEKDEDRRRVYRIVECV